MPSVTKASFSVNFTQWLSHEGILDDTIPNEAKLSDGDLIRLFEVMSLIRAFDKKAIALQRTGKMGTYASTLGQEAISTAIGHTLEPSDVFIPYYRDYAAQYLRGVKMEEIYQYWGGDERGSAFANNAEDLPISVPIASQCLHACGIAYAMKYRQQKKVALVTCGDGGTSEGDFYEAINVAGAWDLPVVFVVNNNQWAISVPLALQTKAETIAQKAIAAGIDGIQVDGNDIFALTQQIGHAINKARTQHKPTVIEALSYRLCDHTTADDASRYRDNSELENAWDYDPITRVQTYLRSRKIWRDEDQKKLDEQNKKKVQAAVDAYLNTGSQAIENIFQYMYEQMPENLLIQMHEAKEQTL